MVQEHEGTGSIALRVVVYLPYFGGFIIAVDLDTGTERWRYGDFTQGFLWAPAPAGNRVLAVGASVGLVALPAGAEVRQ